MTTTYRRKPKVRVLCACGCGRYAEGNRGRKYYEPYCRLKAFLARKAEAEEKETQAA